MRNIYNKDQLSWSLLHTLQRVSGHWAQVNNYKFSKAVQRTYSCWMKILNKERYLDISPVHVKTWHLEKSWDLVIFALIFSEFGYVPDFFYVPNFFLEHSQIQKKSRQKWLSQNFFLSVKFCTCVFYYINFWKHWIFLSVKFGT